MDKEFEIPDAALKAFQQRYDTLEADIRQLIRDQRLKLKDDAEVQLIVKIGHRLFLLTDNGFNLYTPPATWS